MSATEQYLANNARYAETFSGPLPMPPAAHVAVVACMDARLNVYGMLGLGEGEAHVIRNAGGVVTDDQIRSLAISQRLLGTKEIVLIHHTDCGMLTFTDDAFKRSIQDETGIKPAWSAEAFGDLDEDVRQLQVSPLGGPIAFGTAQVFRARNAREFRELSANPEAVPVVARDFSRTDRLLIRVPVYSNPPPFVINQVATTYDPGAMGAGTTYYWRIDEVNSSGTTNGPVWSFTTLPLPGPATGRLRPVVQSSHDPGLRTMPCTGRAAGGREPHLGPI